MIGERGFGGTSIRALAAAAGVTYGTVQHHFPSKKALWEAIVDEVLVPRLRRPRSTKPTPSQLGNAVEIRVRGFIEAAVRNPGLSGRVLIDMSEGAHERIAYLAAAARSQQEVNFKMLGMLAKQGYLRDIDPHCLAALMGVALASLSSAGFALQEMFDIDIQEPEQRERLVAGITDILLHGLLPRD